METRYTKYCFKYTITYIYILSYFKNTGKTWFAIFLVWVKIYIIPKNTCEIKGC